MTPASELVKALGVPIEALSVDSRRIGAATAFVAYPGDNDDGRSYIDDAVAAGSAGVFWEAHNFSWRRQWQVPNVAVENLKARSGYLADAVYGAPSRQLPLVAITGTNGKTTAAFFTAQLLAAAGISSGILGTLGAGSLRQLSPLANTTPDAVTLHQWLRRFVNDGMAAAVLEASSHGIAQGRLNGVQLAAAVLTNVTQDHLDYHQTMEQYWQAKAALFELPLQAAIINADDKFCRRLLSDTRLPLFSYGQQGAALRWLRTETDERGGLRLLIDGVLGRHTVQLPAFGLYNVYNFFAAALAAHTLQADSKTLVQAAATLTLPAGRMQKVNDAPAVYIDYAHTPTALEAVLTAARTLSGSGRLFALIGAGGNRDRAKRADMGRIAAAGADVVIVTDDNPRNEDPAEIRAELCKTAAGALNIGGRAQAIAAALNEARAEDTILIFGKGHEVTQEIGGETLPFSDADVVRRAVQSLQ